MSCTVEWGWGERVNEKQAEFGLLNTKQQTKPFINIRDLPKQVTLEDSTKVHFYSAS